jgi:hypothetical protein
VTYNIHFNKLPLSLTFTFSWKKDKVRKIRTYLFLSFQVAILHLHFRSLIFLFFSTFILHKEKFFFSSSTKLTLHTQAQNLQRTLLWPFLYLHFFSTSSHSCEFSAFSFNLIFQREKKFACFFLYEHFSLFFIAHRTLKLSSR